MNKSSLRRQLVLPYVVLVVFVSVAVGWVTSRAGEAAVKTLTQRVLAEMADHIASATEQHLAGALKVLNAVDPDPAALPGSYPFSDNLASLEARLWIASGLFAEVNDYVYFGGEDGRFAGVRRVGKEFVELRLREPGASQRKVYATAAPGDRSRLLRTDDFDPRLRPWYGIAAGKQGPVWSPAYSDFTTREPTITLARAVRRTDGALTGVLATDVPLKTLTGFLRARKVSDNGIAFVMDGAGFVVATSGGESPFKMAQGVPERLRAEDMQTGLIRDAAARVIESRLEQGGMAPFLELKGAFGRVDVAARSIGRQHGVDWIAVVAVPRSDFMGGMARSMAQGMFIAAVCVLIALVLGLSILNRILRDIRVLTDAARRIGEGEPLPSLNIRRRDEIGQLAMSFSEMEHNLRIDKLTAVFNRASLIAQIAFLRRQLEQKSIERPSFALLFIDLDHFKKINDQHGHAAGDKALMTVAARLKDAVRVTDVVARYGGDEFVVLLKGITAAEDVIAMEEKIRDVVEQPVPVDHGTVRVGVSIGWAMFPEDGEDVEALLKIADKRMFDTKKSRKAARTAQ
ncbi:MAG TPA: diguanylate cyclase [Noviherbaspirillum sp.]